MTGTELKEMLHQAGLTQAQLADKLGYYTKGEPNKSQIARMENGHCPINFRVESAIRLHLRNE